MVTTTPEDISQQPDENLQPPSTKNNEGPSQLRFYRIQFRKAEQIHSAYSKILNLNLDQIIMAQTEHGIEPAKILEIGPCFDITSESEADENPIGAFSIIRRATRDEISKYDSLIDREKEAFDLCEQFIKKHSLEMKLIKVERFFNGSKIIFYFTAENRVDFRELVKDLVQEFRTRVEIRQVGVRHETKLIGGVGCCGRVLCCTSFINNFAPVSIKMAKEQDLPLNPSKISGICNRLLCCLAYEYDTYKKAKRSMPKPGKILSFEGRKYKILQNNVLKETVTVVSLDEESKVQVFTKEQWQNAEIEHSQPAHRKDKKTKKYHQKNSSDEQLRKDQ